MIQTIADNTGTTRAAVNINVRLILKLASRAESDAVDVSVLG